MSTRGAHLYESVAEHRRHATDTVLQPEAAETAEPAVPATPAVMSRRPAVTSDPLGGTEASADVTEALRRRRGQGGALPGDIASQFGRQLGSDVSGVRIHTDPEADTIARSVQSVAFTHGSDIYFSKGAYSPGTDAGDHLLAHELTHVVQGQSGASSAGSGPTIGRADDPAEAQADQSADRVVSALRRRAAVVDGQAGALTAGTGTTDVVRRNPWVKANTQQRPQASGTVTLGQKPKQQGWVTAKTGDQSTGGQQAPKFKMGLKPDPKQEFKDAVANAAAPASKLEARTRMQQLRAILSKLSLTQRKAIADDTALMASGRTFVGDLEYVSLLAAVGAYTNKKKGTAKEKGFHLTGAEADQKIAAFIVDYPHIKPYFDDAVNAGRKGDGYIATLSKDQWNLTYNETFPTEAIGSDDEQDTNAYVADDSEGSPAVLHADRGTPSTAIHESMHRYAENNVLNNYGFNMNEGMTEYFTRMLTDRNAEPAKDGGPERDNYDDQIDMIRTLMPMLGAGKQAQEVTLAEIFFKGKLELFKKAFVDGWKVKDPSLTGKKIRARFDFFIQCIKRGDYAKAKQRLPLP